MEYFDAKAIENHLNGCMVNVPKFLSKLLRNRPLYHQNSTVTVSKTEKGVPGWISLRL